MTDARKIEGGEPGRIERSLEPRRAPRFDRGIPPQIIETPGRRIARGSLGALLTLAPLHWILPLLKAGVPLAAMSNPVTVALIGLLILGILFATGGKKRRRK